MYHGIPLAFRNGKMCRTPDACRYGIRYTENSNIQILQKLLEQAKQNMHNLEEQQRQNERDLKELQHYQKEIDTYLGKKHEDI